MASAVQPSSCTTTTYDYPFYPPQRNTSDCALSQCLQEHDYRPVPVVNTTVVARKSAKEVYFLDNLNKVDAHCSESLGRLTHVPMSMLERIDFQTMPNMSQRRSHTVDPRNWLPPMPTVEYPKMPKFSNPFASPCNPCTSCSPKPPADECSTCHRPLYVCPECGRPHAPLFVSKESTSSWCECSPCSPCCAGEREIREPPPVIPRRATEPCCFSCDYCAPEEEEPIYIQEDKSRCLTSSICQCCTSMGDAVDDVSACILKAAADTCACKAFSLPPPPVGREEGYALYEPDPYVGRRGKPTMATGNPFFDTVNVCLDSCCIEPQPPAPPYQPEIIPPTQKTGIWAIDCTNKCLDDWMDGNNQCPEFQCTDCFFSPCRCCLLAPPKPPTPPPTPPPEPCCTMFLCGKKESVCPHCHQTIGRRRIKGKRTASVPSCKLSSCFGSHEPRSQAVMQMPPSNERRGCKISSCFGSQEPRPQVIMQMPPSNDKRGCEIFPCCKSYEPRPQVIMQMPPSDEKRCCEISPCCKSNEPRPQVIMQMPPSNEKRGCEISPCCNSHEPRPQPAMPISARADLNSYLVRVSPLPSNYFVLENPTSQPLVVSPLHSQLPAVYPLQMPPAYPSQMPPAYPSQMPSAYPSQMPPAYPSEMPPVYPSQIQEELPPVVTSTPPSQMSTSQRPTVYLSANSISEHPRPAFLVQKSTSANYLPSIIKTNSPKRNDCLFNSSSCQRKECCLDAVC